MELPTPERQEGERCGNCRYFAPYAADDVTAKGDCTRRPRQAQSYNDKTAASLWCQYYERKKEVQPEQLKDAFNEAFNIGETVTAQGRPHDGEDSAAVVDELQSMRHELTSFMQVIHGQLVNAALQDSNSALFETKGMLRTANMILQSLDQRIQALSPSVGK